MGGGVLRQRQKFSFYEQFLNLHFFLSNTWVPHF